jgi:hypothetical protein
VGKAYRHQPEPVFCSNETGYQRRGATSVWAIRGLSWGWTRIVLACSPWKIANTLANTDAGDEEVPNVSPLDDAAHQGMTRQEQHGRFAVATVAG